MDEAGQLLAWLGSIALLMSVMAGTPGPNNVLLAASGMQYGFRRTIPLILGIEIGMTSLLVLAVLGVGSLLALVPAATWVLRIAGTGYIAWLAVKLWRHAGSVSDDRVSRPISVWQAAALQFVNPKSWMATFALASGAFGSRSPLPWWEMALGVMTCVAVIAAATSVWALLGSALRRAAGDDRRARIIGRVLAVAAAASAVTFWL